MLCECGTPVHVGAGTCSACGAAVELGTRLRRPWLLRAAAASLLLGVLGAAGWAAWNAHRRDASRAEVWRLRDQAFEAVKAGRYEEALTLLTAVCERRPRDEQMWYLRAVSERAAGRPPAVWTQSARHVLDIDGGFSEAAALLADACRAEGDLGAALSYARRAAEGSRPTAHDFRVLADLELRAPRPSAARALAALRRAQEIADEDPRVPVLIGLLHVRAARGAPIEALPDAVRRDVVRAEHRLATLPEDVAATAEMRLAAAEFAAARGDIAAARRCAEEARLAARDDTLLRARALAVAGRAAVLAGDVAAGIGLFGDALTERPVGDLAAEAADCLVAAGRPDLAEPVVRSALARNDDPALRGVLSAVLAALGRHADAQREVDAALAAAPDDADLLLRRGDLRAAEGDLGGAREAYAAAAARVPGAAAPRLRTARLALFAPGGDDALRDAATRALAELDAVAGADRAALEAEPDYLETRGRLELAAGDVVAAHASVARAVEARPYAPEPHLALADVVARGRSPTRFADAARLAVEAAGLAPFDDGVVERAARLCLAAGAARDAATLCDTLLERRPSSAGILTLLAEAQRRAGHWREAAGALERLATLRRDDPEVRLALVDSLLRAGERAQALRVAAGAAAAGRPDPRLDVVVALHGGSDEDAFARLAAAGPSSALGAAYLAAGRRDDAVRCLRAALAAAPEDAQARSLLVYALLDGGADAGGAAQAPDAGALAEAGQLADACPEGAAPGLSELLRGRVALARGELDRGRGLLEAARTARPFDAYAHFFLGQLRWRAGELPRALDSLRRAAALPGAPPGISQILARCLVSAAGEPDAVAEPLLWEALVHDPADAAATVRLVNLLVARGAWAEAAQLASRLPEIRADLPDALATQLRRTALACGLRAVGLAAEADAVDELPVGAAGSAGGVVDALLAAARGRPEDAVREFEKLLASDAATPLLAAALIECLVRAGRAPEACERLHALEAAGRLPPGAAVALARSLARAGRGDLADAELARVLAARPADVDALRVVVARALRDGVAARALAALDTALPHAAGEDAARLRLLRADVLRATGRVQEALQAARAETSGADAVALEARVAEAEAAAELGDLPAARRAVAAASSGLAAAPGSPSALHGRLRFVEGSLALREGRFREAEDAFEKALALVPDDHAAANNLAYLMSARPGLARRALELARGATAAAPGNASYWDTRGACAAQAGERAEAEHAWRTALDIWSRDSAAPGPAVAAAEVGLAEVLAAGGRWAEAEELARAALRHEADADVARRARELLEGS